MEILPRRREFAPRFAGIASDDLRLIKAMRTAAALAVSTPGSSPAPAARTRSVAGALPASLRRVRRAGHGRGRADRARVAGAPEAGLGVGSRACAAWRSGTGTIVKNPPLPLIEDLDVAVSGARFVARSVVVLSAARHLPAPAGYRAHDRRGCDRNCLFCFQIDF